MNYELYAVTVAALGLIYTMIRNFRKDVENRFDKIGADISEIKDRVTFLEAANIYTMPMEPSEPNPRSRAARDMWQRRKHRKLEKKD